MLLRVSKGAIDLSGNLGPHDERADGGKKGDGGTLEELGGAGDGHGGKIDWSREDRSKLIFCRDELASHMAKPV